MTHSGQDGKEDKGPGNYCILDSMMDPQFSESMHIFRGLWCTFGYLIVLYLCINTSHF